MICYDLRLAGVGGHIHAWQLRRYQVFKEIVFDSLVHLSELRIQMIRLLIHCYLDVNLPF